MKLAGRGAAAKSIHRQGPWRQYIRMYIRIESVLLLAHCDVEGKRKITDHLEFGELDVVDIFHRIAQNPEEMEYPIRCFPPKGIGSICPVTN